MALLCLALFSFALISTQNSVAQSPTVGNPVNPLQWIQLTGLSGAPVPPLKDASIGYDDVSRTLLIFGGESAGKVVQSQTYLLNLDTLSWSLPTPPTNLQRTPPARSLAVSGDDFAASNRHAHVVIGGKGTDGKALSDIWEYDYNNKFWSPVNLSPGNAPARWGATGGIDIRTPFVSDAVVAGPNNTIYMAGGTDGSNIYSFSDIWELRLSGTLSSNLPDSVAGSWVKHTIPNGPESTTGQTGTVLGTQVIITSGCAAGQPCTQDTISYIQNDASLTSVTVGACPAPRVGGTMVPNMNTASSSFAPQAYLLLGLINSTSWDDDGDLAKGEIAILDTNTGSWSRILPAGDPGTNGKPSYPVPRSGAAALSFSSALVGSSRSSASDVIIFGGQDASGNYLSDLWILRAYDSTLTATNQTWGGYGNGVLQTGVSASGTGVEVQYITTCAKEKQAATSSSSTTAAHSPSSVPAPTAIVSSLYDLNVSSTHKVLAPLSAALLLLAVLLFSLASSPWINQGHHSSVKITEFYGAVVMTLFAYVTGIVGLIMSFTSATISMDSDVDDVLVEQNSAETDHLQTAHARAGLVLFVILYAGLPLFFVYGLLSGQIKHRPEIVSQETCRSSSPNEKPPSPSNAPSFRARLLSWTHSRPSASEDHDTASIVSAPPAPPRFEVTNRPSRRPRRASTGRVSPLPPTADMDWMQRRRILNAVSELDHAASQDPNSFVKSRTFGEGATPNPPESSSRSSRINWIFRGILHIALLALCSFTLAALWSDGQFTGFGLLLAWVLVMYIALLIIIRRRRDATPAQSVDTAAILQPSSNNERPITRPFTPSPMDIRGPYTHHQPPFRVSASEEHSFAARSDSSETEDEDDDARQTRMEQEMGRRDVSIITVPRRKLWIANPGV